MTKIVDELVGKMNKHWLQYDEDDCLANDMVKDYKNLDTYQKHSQISFLQHSVKKLALYEICFFWDYTSIWFIMCLQNWFM